MPKLEYPPELEKLNLEEEPYAFSQKDISDAYALTQVMRTFEHYEMFRRTHDARWNLNDKLYYAYVEPKVWPGSNVPRASIGSHLIFEQIMAIYPSIAQAMFSDPEWFTLEAGFGGDPQAIRAQKAHLEYALEFSAAARGTSTDNQFMLGFLSALLYGNGGVMVEYNADLKAPEITWVDTRDVYVDPFCRTPSFQESARSIIVRKFMSVSEIAKLRGDDRMNVPSDAVLNGLAGQFQFRQADSTKAVQESLRGNVYLPGVTSQNPLPDDKQLEVLVYFSKTQIIWVLNGKHVLYNEPNPYGEIPVYFTGAYPVPGRFYWMSLADIQEGNQRYMEGLFNNRLDYMSLMLFPPRFVSRQGYQPSQQTWGPGSVFSYDNPDKQYVHTTSDITGGIYQELGFIRTDADRATGVGSLVSGIPTPSNANRTASGMAQQQDGANLRIYPLIKHGETYMVIPALRMALKQVRLHRDRTEPLPGVVRNPQKSTETEFVNISPDAFEHPSNVVVRAASQMLNAARKWEQFQILSQTLFTPQFAEVLEQQNKTFDFEEIQQCIFDITRLSRQYNFVRDKTEEEIQKQQEKQKQQEQQQANPQIQKAQLEGQTRKEIMQMKIQGDLQKAQMGKEDPQIEAQERQQEMEMEKQKAQMGQQMKMFEMQMKERMAQMEIQFKQMEMQLKSAEMAQKLQLEQAKSRTEAETTIRKAQMEEMLSSRQAQREEQSEMISQRRMEEQHQAGLRQSDESHQAGLKQKQEMVDFKNSQVKSPQKPKK